ncbi:MAG: 50S ribosomal protein L6 [Gammaproteobacteria bacterium]|nr:50S ribosomal protein L6 [Gammaproteobacteria bacterium]|tara:strand:+ start:1965 stop:2498 length:534 start_codon:yes stop_codon:yes gene_type:complete
MSRVADNPVKIVDGVTVDIEGQEVKVDGPKGSLSMTVNASVDLKVEEGLVVFVPNSNDRKSEAMAGTTRALVQNMVLGVSEGFEKRLELQGVGYRAQAKGNQVSLQLGFSHPVDYELPEGISAETPSQTEIVISGNDKQQVGQVCAEIRGFRPPEPYKGKGIRYQGEYVRRKEAKKK